MENIVEICQKVVENVHGGLACGVVDRNSGMIMGMHHIVPHFTSDYLDAVAAAAVEMFHGRTVKRVEELLSAQCGNPVKDSFEEIFISSTAVFHFMKYSREKQVITILVTRKSVSQGMGWASLRNSMHDIIAALP